MITTLDILDELQRGLELPPLKIRLIKRVASRPESRPGPDAIAEIRRGKARYRFTTVLRARMTPRIFEETLRLLRDRKANGTYPLVVASFLREEQLSKLEKHQISGVDLCGNGIVTIPDQLLVYRTGQPNRYPDSQPTKYIYRGITSLVPRVFLCRPCFDSLADIQREIERRGGGIVALSTISKALKRLESDLIVQRRKGEIRLLQAEKLLDAFSRDYQAPDAARIVTCSISSSLDKLYERLDHDTPTVLSGRSSVDAYAVMARDEWPVLLSPQIDAILDRWHGSIAETNRFVDLELRQVRDKSVYFDRRMRQVVAHASPVQTFLELAAGDRREREAARQVREFILKEIAR